jgi:hypothetical protein
VKVTLDVTIQGYLRNPQSVFTSSRPLFV